MATAPERSLSDLNLMLSNLEASLSDDDFVFCSVPGARYGELADTHPLACIAEEEGLSLVLERTIADAHGLAYTGVFRCIKLGVYSSLTAVGLTAAVSAELARHQISANIIAGTHHDYVLVQADHADEALNHLMTLRSIQPG